VAGQQYALGKNGQKRVLGRLAARWQRTVREEHNGEKAVVIFRFYELINSVFPRKTEIR